MKTVYVAFGVLIIAVGGVVTAGQASATAITAWKCGKQYVTSQSTRHDPYGIQWTRSFSFVVFNDDSDVKTGRLFFNSKNFTLSLDGKRCKQLSREEWETLYEAKIGPELE